MSKAMKKYKLENPKCAMMWAAYYATGETAGCYAYRTRSEVATEIKKSWGEADYKKSIRSGWLKIIRVTVIPHGFNGVKQ